MVNEDKLEQWVRSKLEAGVSEERIRESLENTGHDPSIVDRIQDPFSGVQEDGEGAAGETQDQQETEHSDQGSDVERKQEQKGGRDDSHGKDAEDNRRERKEAEREQRAQERTGTWEEHGDHGESSRGLDETANEEREADKGVQFEGGSEREEAERPFQQQPANHRSEPKNEYDSIDREELEKDRKPQPDKGPATPGAPRGRQEKRVEEVEDDGGFSPTLPSIDEREKHVAGAAFVILVLIGLGVVGVSYFELPEFDEVNLVSSEDDGSETSPIAGMDSNCDVGVRVESARAVDGTTEVSLRMFRGEAPAYLRLYDSGQVIEEQEFVMSGTQTKSFNTVGERVEFGPVGCNFEDELRVS